jgi:thioredoxin-related protein
MFRINKIVPALVLMAFSSFWAIGVAAETRDPLQYFFQDSFGDLAEEIETAADEGKQGVVIFFELDDCPFCFYMKQNVLNQREVQEYYRKNFRIIMVDIEGDLEITDFQGNLTTQKKFADSNKVRATPVVAFFNLEGKRIHRFTGKASGPEEFMQLGQFVVDGHYKTMRFTRYKRKLRNDS